MKSGIYTGIAGITVILGTVAIIQYSRHSGLTAQPFPDDLRDAVSDQSPTLDSLKGAYEGKSTEIPAPVKPDLQEAAPQKEILIDTLPSWVTVSSGNRFTVFFGGAVFDRKADVKEAEAFWAAIHKKAGIDIDKLGKIEETQLADGSYTFQIGYNGECKVACASVPAPDYIQMFSGLTFGSLSRATDELRKALLVLKSVQLPVMYAVTAKTQYGYTYRVYYLVDAKKGDRVVSRRIVTGCSAVPDDIRGHFDRVVKLLEGNGVNIISADVVGQIGFLKYIRPEQEDRDIIRTVIQTKKTFRTIFGEPMVKEDVNRDVAQELKKELAKLSASKDINVVDCRSESDRAPNSALIQSDSISTTIDYIKKAR